ncbi:MAG TPA: Fic family protein [Acidimicrobiales bacterium]|nr:Fic family protein [Acidimicrobiales bacterium]
MLFRTPPIDDEIRRALERIDGVRRDLRFYVAEPRRWSGLIRRTALARAIQGSNSIEGYVVDLDDALAAVEGEEPLDAASETWQAVVGYRNAMTYVLQLANDPHFVLNEALLKSLHFMMIGHDLRKNPGKWRPGDIFVRNDASGAIVYEGPDADDVPALMAELIADLEGDDPANPVLIRAAMAHLNLVMIHPFSDGNGRMARCLQTLVLAREGILAPQLSSIEEYLGANTEDYYKVLAEVGQGHWPPTADARPWLRFILTAHYRQARTQLRRVKESEARWGLVEEVVVARKLPSRAVGPLFDAASGRRLRRGSYLAIVEGDLSDAMATRDLRTLVAADLLTARGERRGRCYVATPELTALRERSRRPRSSRDSDPFAPEEAPTLF